MRVPPHGVGPVLPRDGDGGAGGREPPDLLPALASGSAARRRAPGRYAALERGDWSSAEWAHPEIEFGIADGPDPDSWTGIAVMAEAWRDVLSAWEDARIEVNEYRELDDERVLVLVIFHGRGKTSGLEIGSQKPTKAANLLHIRNGKATRLTVYNDRERALADLGLAPRAGS